MRNVLIALMLLIAGEGQAYKFICNGIDADGNHENDQCGTCNDTSGPRWLPATVNVRIDADTRPSSLTKEAWLSVAIGSMESWNNVSGANVKIQHTGDAVRRNFGSDSSNHELFWVTNKSEWRRKVGGGENGALGVTISPYNCPNAVRKAREIYDADLILNGVGKFKWSPTCEKWGDCESIRSTLTHELGHFIGLGHPCAVCSWSIMSAQAGYNIDYPVFDDQEGLRALYPGTSSGEIGTRCDANRDCKGGLTCIRQEDTNYCSKACSDREPCPNGYACDAFEGKDVCKFTIGRLAGAVGLGESCKTQPCEDGLLCAGEDNEHLYCFDMCSPTDKCLGTDTCVPLEGGGSEGVCAHVSKLGEKCDYKSTCDDKLICVIDGEDGKCRKECNPKRGSQCGSGEICSDMGQGMGACVSRDETPPQPGVPSTPGSNEPGHVGGSGGSPAFAVCTCVAVSEKESVQIGMAFIIVGLIALMFARRRQ